MMNRILQNTKEGLSDNQSEDEGIVSRSIGVRLLVRGTPLLHHFLVSGNLSLSAACDLLSDFTRDGLVLEFVPVDDPMFLKLIQYRTTEFDDVTLQSCLIAFGKVFTVESVEQVPGLNRHLLFLRKRNA